MSAFAARPSAMMALIARGVHLAAIQENGQIVESAPGNLRLRDIVATADPARLSRADIMLFAVKLWDTETTARAIRRLIRPGSGVISFRERRG
jgi:2-dehydropantoate 2-reductase